MSAPSDQSLQEQNLGCGVAETLHVIGDRWSLLILRNAFHGVRRFDALHDLCLWQAELFQRKI